MPTVKCEGCGGKFEKTKYHAEKYDTHYCSNDCRKTGRDGDCDNCGEEIRIEPSKEHLDNHFCSQECYNKFRENKVDVECATCGETKTITPKRKEKYDKHYCSEKCLANNRKNGDEYECENCGGSVYRTPSEMERVQHDNVFCSRACFSDWNTGENNERYEKIDVECWWCAETVSKKPYRIKKDKRHFCSTGCFGKWTSWAGRESDVGGTPTGEFCKDMPRHDWNPTMETKQQLKRIGVYDQYKGYFK